jgi:hypothetical protein
LTFFDRPAVLLGTVRDGRGQPDATAMVLLMNANYQSCLEAATFVRCVRSSSVTPAGTFTFSGLIPGDYLLAAVDRSALGSASPQASVLESIAPQAQRVTLGEGQRQTQDLTTRAGAR